jgi:hypothetical protein
VRGQETTHNSKETTNNSEETANNYGETTDNYAETTQNSGDTILYDWRDTPEEGRPETTLLRSAFCDYRRPISGTRPNV